VDAASLQTKHENVFANQQKGKHIISSQIENPAEGYGKGSFVVIKGVR
jgi:hypothetical protein